MTREEQIRQKAISEQRSLMESCDWRAGFIAGAKWADKTMIDKACEWLKMSIEDYDVYDAWRGNYIDTETLINDLKKAMKGE